MCSVFNNFQEGCGAWKMKINLTYQDIGQIDFYVKYFEENIKTEGDNPTIGIIFCSEKNETMIKYSVLNENDYLFASKYKLYIPSEEELKEEIERERFNIEQRLEDKKGVKE